MSIICRHVDPPFRFFYYKSFMPFFYLVSRPMSLTSLINTSDELNSQEWDFINPFQRFKVSSFAYLCVCIHALCHKTPAAGCCPATLLSLGLSMFAGSHHLRIKQTHLSVFFVSTSITTDRLLGQTPTHALPAEHKQYIIVKVELNSTHLS